MSSLPLLVLLGVIGPWQVVIIVALILVLFGGKKIPELMRGMAVVIIGGLIARAMFRKHFEKAGLV